MSNVVWLSHSILITRRIPEKPYGNGTGENNGPQALALYNTVRSHNMVNFLKNTSPKQITDTPLTVREGTLWSVF